MVESDRIYKHRRDVMYEQTQFEQLRQAVLLPQARVLILEDEQSKLKQQLDHFVDVNSMVGASQC